MNRKYICIVCACVTFFSACSSKKDTADPSVKLPKLGISLKLPKSFQPLPQEQLGDMERLGATILAVEPFTVIPHYAYMESSGKGILIISELKFEEDAVSSKFPMDNIYLYKKNLEMYFASGRISSEEMGSNEVSTVLMAMMFQEGKDDIALFKGLCYVYPDRFFMLDLYVIKDKAVTDDAVDYINIFSSLGIY
jgi:hypothetical protein